jgi:hypothetical protein
MDYLPPLALFAATIGYLAVAYRYDGDARSMPVAFGWTMLLLLAIDIAIVTRTQAGMFLARLLNPSVHQREELGLARQVGAIFWPLLFTLLLVLIGVAAAVPIYIFASMRFHGGWSLRWSIATASIASAATWILFEVALRTPLYAGLLWPS